MGERLREQRRVERDRAEYEQELLARCQAEVEAEK
jgi:hypothetical protein